MRCPQCGTRNPLGSERCTQCGRPFTRAASRNQRQDTYTAGGHAQNDGPAGRAQRPDVHVHYGQHADPYDDGYYAAQPPRRRRLPGCLTTLIVLLALSAALIIGLIVATDVFVRPRVADAISERIGSGIETTVRDQISTEIGELPSGEITISEAEINQKIAERGNLGPVDDLTIDILRTGAEANLSAYGLSGTYTADIQYQDGRIVFANSDVGGPLQYLVPEGEIERIASDAINRSLAESGYRVEGVTLHDGELVLTLAR